MKILKRSRGFTLVELVITIAIVIILSVISVPIYRGYVDKAKYSEGYALGGLIISAEKAYYSEYGMFLRDAVSIFSSFHPGLNIDARGNKYFTSFRICYNSSHDPKTYFSAIIEKPLDLRSNNVAGLAVYYHVTSGGTITENI